MVAIRNIIIEKNELFIVANHPVRKILYCKQINTVVIKLYKKEFLVCRRNFRSSILRNEADAFFIIAETFKGYFFMETHWEI